MNFFKCTILQLINPQSKNFFPSSKKIKNQILTGGGGGGGGSSGGGSGGGNGTGGDVPTGDEPVFPWEDPDNDITDDGESFHQ